MKRKSLTPWIVMLVAPIPALILVAMMQVLSRAVNIDALRVVVNIISILVGIVAVVALMGFPLWLIMLILSYSHNEKLK